MAINNRINSKTKSRDERVLILYNIILDDENSDDDYWHAIGYEAILSKLSGFEMPDWKELEKDLVNWTSTQLYILANALVKGGREADIGRNIISERSFLFAYTFSIVDENTAFDLLDEFSFISEGDKKPLTLLQIIQTKFEMLKLHPSIELFYSKEKVDSIAKFLDNEIKIASR